MVLVVVVVVVVVEVMIRVVEEEQFRRSPSVRKPFIYEARATHGQNRVWYISAGNE